MSKTHSVVVPKVKRGRGHPLGYGYVGRVQPVNSSHQFSKLHKQYTKQPEYEMCFQEGQTLATQRVYKKKEKHTHSKTSQEKHTSTSTSTSTSTQKETSQDVRIQNNVPVSDYVEYVSKLLYQIKYNNKYDKIRLLAHSRNICKLIECVEIIKREIHGLHQLTELTAILVINEYIPLQKGFKTVRNETETSQVEIYLSFKNILDTSHIGYQAPIKLVDANEIKTVFDEKVSKLQSKIDKLQAQLSIMNSFEKFSINLNQNSNKLYNKERENNVKSERGCESESDSEEVIENECEKWDPIDVVNFMVNLDFKKYNKYYDSILEGLNREGIDGSCLKYITKQDLLRLGISQFKDRTIMYRKIQKFVLQSDCI